MVDELFKRALDRLFDSYGRKNDAQYRAYASVLLHSGVPAPLLYAAVERCVLTCKFFPTVAEIVQAAEDMAGTAGGCGAPNAEEAWAEVARAAYHLGWNRKPEWSHPDVGRAVDAMGGWLAVCECESSEWGNFGARYRKVYEGLARGQRSRKLDEFLLGGHMADIARLIAERRGREIGS